MVVALRGMFTEVPVEEVSVMVFTSTRKERILVLGGGVRGDAVMVMLTVAVLVPQLTVHGLFPTPLHEVKEKAASKSSAAKTLRKFISPPRVRLPKIEHAQL